ncbi:MAG: GNAT family N-acetyltransferase [Gammaproteobacteria bacterium]
MASLSEVEALSDSGLRGDRYADASLRKSPDYQVTLIEIENIEAFARASGLFLALYGPRRNLVTSGVNLNDLCSKRFFVGEVELEGLEFCEPCATFAKYTHPEVVRFFVHKGGLRARIIRGGVIRVGDPVREFAQQSPPADVTANAPQLSFTLGITLSKVMAIRKARKDEAQVIWEIRNAAINSQCVGHYSPEDLEIWTSGEMTKQFIDIVESSFYVATVDGCVVGTGMINLESGKLDAIFVRPPHIRTGIGKQIMLHLEKLALDAGLTQLSLESTLNAVTFYQAQGFVGDSIAKYVSPKGISLECIPMLKVFLQRR